MVSIVSPSFCHEMMGLDAMILVFECWVLSQLFHSPLSLSSRGSSVPLCFLPLGWCHLHIWDYWYFSSPEFLMMYPAYKLNKQGDNIQPWHTPFPIWSQSVAPCLTVASWPAYRFLRRQVRWSGIPISWRIFPQFVVIHTVKGFGIVNKAVDVFLELSCFFDDPMDVGNLISGSSAFSNPAFLIKSD